MSVPRWAPVPPQLAVWLVARVSSRDLREYVQRVRVNGYGGAADELEFGWAQLEAAATGHHRRLAVSAQGPTSVSATGSGTAETVDRRAESAHEDEVTAAEAAAMLGLKSARRVIQLIAGEHLRARKVGRVWLVEVASVQELKSLRRTA